MDDFKCNKCKSEEEELYGYKPYDMKNDEFYCSDCFEEVHGVSFQDIGEVE